MKDKVEKALDNFVEISKTEKELEKIEQLKELEKLVEKAKIESSKKIVLDEREGLIERVDKILVTKDGKQLLREQY